jgi:putative oxidoreductase
MTVKTDVSPGAHPPVKSKAAGGLSSRWRTLSPYLLSVLRIVSAFLFMQYGTAKLFAFPAAILPGGGTPPLLSLTGIAGVLEVFGGLLVLLGLFTRPVAFLLSGQMAVAYWMFHAPQGFWPMLTHGDPAAFFCFVWLYISAAGPGPGSLDALRER